MKDNQQINSMSIKLELLKQVIPHFNKYRESNGEAIDCQLAVLEHKLTEDDCWNQWPTHHQGQDMYNREKALEAVKWLWGEGKDLVELWQQKEIST